MKRISAWNIFLLPALTFAFIVHKSLAQQPEPIATKLGFEVASVRPNEKWKYASDYSLDSDDAFVAGKEFFVADGSLSTFIAFAYKLDQQNSMLTNLPPWAGSQSYEIRARVPGNPTKDQVREMMRSLLAERFHLALHFEKLERPVFVITLARPDRMGPGLHLHKSCEIQGNPPRSDEAITVLDWLPCNVYFAMDRPGGATFAAARNTTMRQLCAFLSNVGGLGRTVVNGSGISGAIDFGIEYARPRMSSGNIEAAPSAEPLESSLGTQLGLKLSPQKAVLDVPIVDHVELPTEN